MDDRRTLTSKMTQAVYSLWAERTAAALLYCHRTIADDRTSRMASNANPKAEALYLITETGLLVRLRIQNRVQTHQKRTPVEAGCMPNHTRRWQ